MRGDHVPNFMFFTATMILKKSDRFDISFGECSRGSRRLTGVRWDGISVLPDYSADRLTGTSGSRGQRRSAMDFPNQSTDAEVWAGVS